MEYEIDEVGGEWNERWLECEVDGRRNWGV